MSLRVRRRDTYDHGYRTYVSNGTISSRTLQSYEICEDNTLPFDNLTFYVKRLRLSGGKINGRGLSDLNGWIYQDYPATFQGSNSSYDHLLIPNRPSNGELATEFLARTQPMSSELIAWEYISDLADLGRNANDKADEFMGRLKRLQLDSKSWRALRGAARVNVVTRFGLIPLLSDIRTLLKFQRAVDRRAGVMKRLYGNTGYRRTDTLWRGSSTETRHDVYLHTSGNTIKGTVNRLTTEEKRVHVRWKALFPLNVASADFRAMAEKQLSGFTLDPFVAYELMPWSWLVDYFTNVGQIVKINKNMFTVRHLPPVVMTHTKTVTRSSNHTEPNGKDGKITTSPIRNSYVTKNRLTASTSIFDAQEPILTNGQLSILGSLAVLRKPRGA